MTRTPIFKRPWPLEFTADEFTVPTVTDAQLDSVHADLDTLIGTNRFALTDEGVQAIKRRHDSAGEAER